MLVAILDADLVSPSGDIPLLLCPIDVHAGNVHPEHSERESNTNRDDGTELCRVACEPRETEDNRPCDGGSGYMYDEVHTFRTPVQPGGETRKCKHDGRSNDIYCEGFA